MSDLGTISKDTNRSCVFDFPDRPANPGLPTDPLGHPDTPWNPYYDWHPTPLTPVIPVLHQGPRLPIWNYYVGTPPPQVILYYYHGQNVGFPNSYGGYDGDVCTLHDIINDLYYYVRADQIADKQKLVFFGVTFGCLHRYIKAEDSLIPKLKNDGYVPLSKPNIQLEMDDHSVVLSVTFDFTTDGNG